MKLKSPWREYLIVLSIVGFLAAVNGAASSAEAGNFIETLLYLGGAIICVFLVCIRWFVRKRGQGDRAKAPLRKAGHADIASVLVSRVPPERWPKGAGVTPLLECGPNGRLLQVWYQGQEYSWGLYEQNGHAGAGVVIAASPDGKHYVALVHQWRPGDKESIELPAGNIGVRPTTMLRNFLKEIVEEVGGQLEIRRVTACQGLAHDIVREIAANGEGPKCFFYFYVECNSNLVLHDFRKGDEGTICQWYSVEEVVRMVRIGRIADMVTILGLLLTGIIAPQDVFGPAGATSFDITPTVRELVGIFSRDGLRVVDETMLNTPP